MTAHKKASAPDRAIELTTIARQVLAENGEQPDNWIIAGSEHREVFRFFCISAPFPIPELSHGPLLEMAYPSNLSLAVLLTVERNEVETLACASYGYLGNLLCENDATAEDFPPDWVETTRLRRNGPPGVALRTALQEMIRLGYSRLSEPVVLADPKYPQYLELAVRPDGGVKMHRFFPEATLGQLSEAMARIAPKAKLTRLRQTAQDCGGCGRCCHDTDIPLTYFDVRSVATHRLPDLYQRNPAAALNQMHQMLAVPRAALPDSPVAAPHLYFRKKDGSSGANSPCVFLDGRGLCGVYQGRPLLCRLYHCAEPSSGVEHLYKSAFYTVEWLGRAIEAGLLRPSRPITLLELLEQPLVKLASPFALKRVNEEISSSATNYNPKH